MHTTAMGNGKLFFETYVAPLGDVSVVDIGAQDVNGSLREVCPAHARYIGVDFAQGKGVDVVLTDPYTLPFETDSVDVVVSSSCFEHSEMFWLVFTEILRILRPGGLFYLNVPSNGMFHRYPVDCWRFYPDSGKALLTWARRCGFRPALLESFISHQERELWNDFVAVFLKDEARIEGHSRRMLASHRSFENGRLHGTEGIAHPVELPEDQRRYQQLWQTLSGEHARSQHIAAGVAEVSQRADPLDRALAQIQKETESARRDLDALRDRLASLETALKSARIHSDAGPPSHCVSGSTRVGIEDSALQAFGNASTVALHRMPQVATERPFLVFVRAGAEPIRQTHWNLDAPGRRFDLLANFYAPPRRDCWLLRSADYVTSGGLSKFHAAKLLLSGRLIERYAGFLFLDDDVETLFDPGAFADFVQAQGFGLAQASLTADSFHSHATTLHHPSCAWRETNFVEVMAPFFSRDVLRSAISDFDRSISTWGLDILWGVRHAASRIAVVDLFTMRHYRPIDTRAGAFYLYLRGMGVDPAHELLKIMDELQLQKFDVTTSKVTFRPSAIGRPAEAAAAA
jgi:SAM-dependent methyltransferase